MYLSIYPWFSLSICICCWPKKLLFWGLLGRLCRVFRSGWFMLFDRELVFSIRHLCLLSRFWFTLSGELAFYMLWLFLKKGCCKAAFIVMRLEGSSWSIWVSRSMASGIWASWGHASISFSFPFTFHIGYLTPVPMADMFGKWPEPCQLCSLGVPRTLKILNS